MASRHQISGEPAMGPDVGAAFEQAVARADTSLDVETLYAGTLAAGERWPAVRSRAGLPSLPQRRPRRGGGVLATDPAVRDVFNDARREAGERPVEAEHLLLALLTRPAVRATFAGPEEVAAVERALRG